MTANVALSYTMVVEVFLQSGVVRGLLETNQDRLSSYLAVRQGEEVFALKEATLQVAGRESKPFGSQEYLVYAQEVLLIADLSVELSERRADLGGLFVKKERNKALLGVGPYLLQGDVHLKTGSALQELLAEKSRFMPVTDATFADRSDLGPRTYLVNRVKIGFITALGDASFEF